MRERRWRSELEAIRHGRRQPDEPDEEGGRTLQLLGLGVLIGLGVAVAVQWPEIHRYLRMRSM